MFQQHSFLSIGTIDEVNQEINMIWVQPRVLDLNQVLHNEKPHITHRDNYVHSGCHDGEAKA